MTAPAVPLVQVPPAGGQALIGATLLSTVACCCGGTALCAGYLQEPAASDFTMSAFTAPVVALVLAGLVGAVLGWFTGRSDEMAGRAQPRIVVLVAAVLLGGLPAVLAYMLSRATASRAAETARRQRAVNTARAWADWDRWWSQHPDPLAAARQLASAQWGVPGAVVGMAHDPPGRQIRTASPRGAALVLGPPASGKTTVVVIPTILLAPGACVASSIKLELAIATAPVRSRQGTCWVFDPGGAPGALPAGLRAARWSPLSGVSSWDTARQMATRMGDALRRTAGGDSDAGNMIHFVDKARDWLECLFYAAHLAGEPIGTVATWCSSARHPATLDKVETILREPGTRRVQPGEYDVDGPELALAQLRELQELPDRERGSVVSTLQRMVRVYGSSAARAAGEVPNFDVDAFVRSGDTLYVVTAVERVREYGPIVAALLEEVRHAAYRLHRARELRLEPPGPHVTMALDEANNTALIDIDSMVSEAGGQGLHLLVGLQDMSLARARWGLQADGWLTLFRVKVALPGIIDPSTLHVLSQAAGQQDRTVVSYSQSTQLLSRWLIPWTKREPSWSTTRQAILEPGAISQIPEGACLVWEGAVWTLIDAPQAWADPVWQAVIRRGGATPT